MRRAALILYGEQSNKIMFWVLGKPNEIGFIHLNLEEEYEILILEIPYPKDEKNKAKADKIVNKFLRSNNIEYAFYINQEDKELNSTWHTIKILNIIKEVSRILGVNLFNQSFGIISDRIEHKLIEALSEEAASIMILKSKENEKNMVELYNKIITETGLSLAFVQEIEYLIEQSKTIIWEASSTMEKYNSLLPYPIINSNRILISPKEIKDWDTGGIELKYSEEIGKFIIMLLSKKSIWDIASCFPYLYFLSEDGETIEKLNKGQYFAKDNKALTIQKC